MELRQLKYFVKVASTLNFSEAAKALNITQSTLSQQIRQLEQEIDMQLFERNSHTVNLTEAGTELVPFALQTIHAAETCTNHMQDLKQLLTGTLNIGVTFTFSPLLTETLLTFMKTYPKVKLNIYYKPMEELMNILIKHEIDFVLAFKPTQRYTGIESHVLFSNHLAVIVNQNHSLAQKEKISLSEIEKFDIALPAHGLQARNAFDLVMARYCPQLRVRVELNEVHILLKLIRQSNLITILSEATIHDEKEVKAIPIDVPENEMEGCIHMLENSYRKHSTQAFIRLLSESNAIRKHIHEWV